MLKAQTDEKRVIERKAVTAILLVFPVQSAANAAGKALSQERMSKENRLLSSQYQMKPTLI